MECGGIAPLAGFSAFSFGEGVALPARLARGLEAAGQAVLPVTDRMGFWGLVPAIKAAQEHELRLLAGLYAPLAGGGAVFLYPDDEMGYRALCRMASRFHREQAVHADGNVQAASLADLTGNGRMILVGRTALQAAGRFAPPASTRGGTNEGWQRFWGIPAAMSRAEAGRQNELAERIGAAPVAFVAQRAAAKGDAMLLRILRALHGNTLAAQTTPLRALPPESPEQLAGRFGWFPEAVVNAARFAETPTWTPPLGTWHLPRISPDHNESLDRLRALADSGIRRRYRDVTPRVSDRLAQELTVIADQGFADYFLLVHELVQEAEGRGHRVLGRGSAANSIVSYALGLTHVEPISNGLFFERFLNPGRTSPPDIDLDFSWRIRDEIYEFLARRWGLEQVALISTHVTLGGRGALREVGKALGFPAEELSRFSRAIGSWPLARFLSEGRDKPEARNLPFDNIAFRRLLTLASRLEGLPTHFSLHAGGVVVAPGGLDRFTPVQPSSKAIPMTQMEMHAVEAVGLVKIDLLSQRSLGVYADVTTALDRKPLDEIDSLAADPAVAKALATGDTMGVFYIESPGMRSLLAKLGCKGFGELTAASSVIRPGVAESGMMQAYIARHRDRSKIPPAHPLLADVLRETHGVMIYQEDVMRVAQAMAGMSLAEADLLRRAMSGKTRGDLAMAATHDRFLRGAAERGVDTATANEIWRQIESFSGYAFCKAHSASYAVLSLQLLWLKCHYPALFMARVLDNRGGFYGPQAYLAEARRHGAKVLPPDLDRSGWDCLVDGSTVTLGFSFIKNLRRETVDRLLEQRTLRPFDDLADVLERVHPDDGEWENLLDSGALARFGPPAACRWFRSLAGSGRLFAPPPETAPLFSRRQLSPLEKAHLEWKAMGLIVSLSPLDLFKLPDGLVPSTRLADRAGGFARTGGLLIAAKSVTTKKGERMKFLSLEDRHGTFEVTLFPRVWRKVGHLIEDGGVFIVGGRVDCEQGVASIVGSSLERAPLVSR